MIHYFIKQEFKCPCCGENDISDTLVKKLDMAREIAGTPFVITSGYRCDKHNREVGGSPTSSHLLGLAVDIKATNSRERFSILNGLIKAGFTRFGIGSNFIHADIDASKPQNVCWTYYAH